MFPLDLPPALADSLPPELEAEPTQAFRRVLPVELPEVFEEPEAERTQSFRAVLRPSDLHTGEGAAPGEVQSGIPGEDTDAFDVTLPIEPAAPGPSDITSTQSFPAVLPIEPFSAQASEPQAEPTQVFRSVIPTQPTGWGAAVAGEEALAPSWLDEDAGEGGSWIQTSAPAGLWGEAEPDEDELYDEETRELDVDPSSWLSGAPAPGWIAAGAASDWVEVEAAGSAWLEGDPTSGWVEAGGQASWLSDAGDSAPPPFGGSAGASPFGGGSAFGSPSSFAASLGSDFEPPEE